MDRLPGKWGILQNCLGWPGALWPHATPAMNPAASLIVLLLAPTLSPGAQGTAATTEPHASRVALPENLPLVVRPRPWGDRRPSRTLIFEFRRPKLAGHARVPFVVSPLPVRWLPIPFRTPDREPGPPASTRRAQTPGSQTQTPLRRPTALGWPAAHLASLATGPTALPTPNHHRLAPPWLSPFLALEIPNSRRKTLCRW